MCIFTQQLYALLQKHNRDLDSLYAVVVPGSLNQKQPLAPEKIKRMKKIIEEEDYSKSTTLNPAEIEAVRLKFAFTDREIERLRSALAGEFIFRYLLDRTSEVDRALRAGKYVFRLLYDVKPQDAPAIAKRIVLDLRPIPALEEQIERTHEEEQIEHARKMEADLAPTIELYEEALLCLDAAQTTKNQSLRRGYRAMALSLLKDADELITYPSEIVDGSNEQAEWKQLIMRALGEMEGDDI